MRRIRCTRKLKQFVPINLVPVSRDSDGIENMMRISTVHILQDNSFNNPA